MRQHLLDLSPRNYSTLEKIDSSLFALSLDCPTSASSSASSLRERRDAHLHNTAYGSMGRNRWFDKTISFSVETNTRLGMMGEHSPCDALIPSILGDFTVAVGMDTTFLSQDPTPDLSGWTHLGWDVDDIALKACRRVQEEVKLSIRDSDDGVLWFEDYGVDWMRQVGEWMKSAPFSSILISCSQTISRRIYSNGPPARFP
jgi:Choline/Carnitine o-acyltransferase